VFPSLPGNEEKKLFELIKNMNDVSLQLMEKQIPYLNATLLYGESGVGKTAFSRYVAYKLEIPYLYVNFSRMLDSYLGGTAKNLTNLFNFINQHQCVVMLDEIDSLAVKREYGGGGASAEVSRSTTCLLQLLDSVTNDHVIIAATNLIDDVDTAVKRRFTEKHELHRLSTEDNERFIRQYLDDAGFSYDLDSVRKYAAENHSQAEIMTHVTRSIASTLINKDEMVML
jgi:AAA+ superfamily predicted ATPase